MTTYNSTPSVEQLLYTNVDRVVTQGGNRPGVAR